MAKNLRLKVPEEDLLVVYDVNKMATSRFADEMGLLSAAGSGTKKVGRVEVGDGVRNVLAMSETIITMLPEPHHVKDVYGQILDTSLMSSQNPSSLPKLFIDCSTIDIATSQAVGAAVRASSHAGEFVDAPVSGGVVGAQAGTLTFMLGSPPHLLQRINPLLEKMGKRVIHCGDPGAGLAGKLSNNYLLAVSNIATAEAMNLGMRLGLDKEVLKDLINVSSGRCWSSEVNNPVDNVEKGFEGGFGVGLMKKDLNLAISAAEWVGAKLELGGRTKEIYEIVGQDRDCRGKDFSVVYRWLGGDEKTKKN